MTKINANTETPEFTGYLDNHRQASVKFRPDANNETPVFSFKANHEDLKSTFNFGSMLQLDKQGFHYRGQIIEDAGEAHRLFMHWLNSTIKGQATPVGLTEPVNKLIISENYTIHDPEIIEKGN